MNNPIHTAIIEDEQPAARLLDGLIKNYALNGTPASYREA